MALLIICIEPTVLHLEHKALAAIVITQAERQSS